MLPIMLCLLLDYLTPRLDHAARFQQDQETISAFRRLNREYREYLIRTLDYYPDSELIRVVIMETDDLYHAWDLLGDAIRESWSVGSRRMALLELLRIIGNDSFRNGIMPPHVPVWRFNPVR